MVGAMTGLFATLSCLSTDEFQAAGPALGMDPDDSQGFKCVFDALGGPEELTALMQPDAGPPLTVFSAAMACNLETQKARLYCTGSMSPTLTCLDMPTVAREFGPADILADSIIAFRAPDCFESDYYDDVPIMHRVTEVLDGPDGLPMYTTAGDARGEADPCPVPYENVVGLVIGITYDAYPGNAGMYNETQAAAGAFWAASDVYDEAVTDYEVALSNYEVALSVYEVALSDYENVVARYDQRYEELCGFPRGTPRTPVTWLMTSNKKWRCCGMGRRRCGLRWRLSGLRRRLSGLRRRHCLPSRRDITPFIYSPPASTRRGCTSSEPARP